MMICDRCSSSIPDGARFCASCGDPVNAADSPGRVAPPVERVQLVCPHCEHQSLFDVASHGVAQLTCSVCTKAFNTQVVRIRSKRSAGQKKHNTRSFTVRVESLAGREDLIEFVRPSNEDFELRSRDLAAFSSVQGKLTVVQNLSVGQYMKLAAPGCGVILGLIGGLSMAGALALWV